MIRIVLDDDHNLVRDGIRALLEQATDIEVVGDAQDGMQAVELVRELKPDVLVMDIGMPHLNGVQATGKIKTLDLPTQVLILSMHTSDLLVREALMAGAKGYLLKHSVAEELLLAVRTVSSGLIYLSPPISAIVAQGFISRSKAQEESNPIDQLTVREREVLQLIAEGNTNQAIAHMLHITVNTVERHRANLISKLDVHDVAGLTRLAIQYGLIFLEE
jgi:DNA-binding NarL/FixJ family response regulator